ncbi:glycosyltransferase [Novosphingobium sp.]|uniref:glycosyltransferase family 2 protein n=1 Tax=Novosphingobium sp. TaxID=1874826 RepID=UPI00163DDFAC|nr:glycosyltransferase [Novosphingobium sp.]
MSLSVLTIVRNRPGHLVQLVKGLQRSSVLPDELIVVDMGSDSPVVLEDLPFPARVVWMDGGRLPLAAARNAAARSASNDHLLFLDVDCIPMRGLIRAVQGVLASHNALVCAQVLYLGPDEARAEWDEQDLFKRAAPHPARSFPGQGVRSEDNAGLFWSLVFGITRQRFFALGGFDEEFVGYGAEDTDFGFRAKAAGVPLLFMGGPGAFHQFHQTFDPPLQHLDDIVSNAGTFHRRWGIWPMEGWLKAFAEMGLVALSEDAITPLRPASCDELAQADSSRRSH